MFTGIVQGIGITKNRKGNFITIEINQKVARSISIGGSVSVDGVCLTALPSTPTSCRGARQRQRDYLTFELMDSTLQRTTLGQLKIGALVNIEPALLAGQPLGGHFVSGHVDGIGVVKSWQKPYLKINTPSRLKKYLIPQGSVTINGVSLTLVAVGKDFFTLSLTDYTQKHTNLKNLQKSDKVNIEVDLLAKYVRNRCK